jgi:hypothetical protein
LQNDRVEVGGDIGNHQIRREPAPSQGNRVGDHKVWPTKATKGAAAKSAGERSSANDKGFMNQPNNVEPFEANAI